MHGKNSNQNTNKAWSISERLITVSVSFTKISTWTNIWHDYKPKLGQVSHNWQFGNIQEEKRREKVQRSMSSCSGVISRQMLFFSETAYYPVRSNSLKTRTPMQIVVTIYEPRWHLGCFALKIICLYGVERMFREGNDL